MNTLRIIYHLARADFLERIRRTSFWLMLGLVVWIGYLSASGQATISMNLHYFGIVNSAWIGAVRTLTVSMFLFIVGFYIVKGSVSRDYETGVGQIMATTPLSRPLYMLGKWLSNFAVLGITILIILLEGIVMNLLADAKGFDLWALAAPLVLIALPGMGLVAALAVLFESIHWLRGRLWAKWNRNRWNPDRAAVSLTAKQVKCGHWTQLNQEQHHERIRIRHPDQRPLRRRHR